MDRDVVDLTGEVGGEIGASDVTSDNDRSSGGNEGLDLSTGTGTGEDDGEGEREGKQKQKEEKGKLRGRKATGKKWRVEPMTSREDLLSLENG